MNDFYSIPEYMSGLKETFLQFIGYKKSTGRKERLYVTVLKSFDTYCVTHSPSTATLDKSLVEGFLQISEQRRIPSVLTYASVLRELGKFVRDVLGNNGAYVTKLSGSRKSRYTPYIFSKAQIAGLLKEANAFRSCNDNVSPNMSNSVTCLYAMLYCTGARVSEALSLKLSDVSLDKATVLVTESKSGRQRLLPIAGTLVAKCRDYLAQRRSIHNKFFFDSGAFRHEGRIGRSDAYRYFRILLERSGILHRGRGEGPRLHDLRDTFAVHSLQRLVEMGGDTNTGIEYLSLYLGHRSIYETQDYLWMTEELADDMLHKTSGDTAFLSEEFRRKVVDADV